METPQVNINEIAKVWPIAAKFVSVVHTKKEYERAVSILDELVDEVGENENHPLATLMETIGTLIENYENEHYPNPSTDPIGTLRFLMEEHDLKQSDLQEIGSQGVVSEILKGKRELNVRQIKSLSKRFRISPAIFF